MPIFKFDICVFLLAPDAHLLFAQKSSISRMMLNMDEAPEIVLPIQGLRNMKAIAHDPIHGHIYWIDGRTKTIKRALDNGTDVSALNIVLKFYTPNWITFDPLTIYDHYFAGNCGHPKSTFWRSLPTLWYRYRPPFPRHLYWSDSMHNVINVTRLDMVPVGVVVKGSNQKPRSIALAPEKG